MSLGAREILMILRAKDQASRVISDVGRAFSSLDDTQKAMAQQQIFTGQALVGLGVGFAALGAGGLTFFKSATDAAIEYNNQAAKTLTQIDELGVSLEDVKRIGRDVAKEIPAPFEQMQQALFDIFSSIDVSVADSEVLLRLFAKAAVAGQTDVSTVARSNFEIMNAFGLDVDDVSRLLDVQFQLVKKGIGTYADINSGIGRLAPTATVAGQTIETMAGSLAFATRIMGPGGSAISSVARAFEALANPKVGEKLRDIGVEVRDSSGEFRPFNDVLTDLSKKLRDLPGPDRVAAITDIFKGAGSTIQARRFLNEAILQIEDLNSQVGSMQGSAGQMEKAYQVMFDDPQVKMQLFENKWMVLKTLVGDAVLPIFIEVLTAISKLVEWFNNLSPSMQRVLVIGGLIASGLLLLVGIVTAAAGAILILSGTAALLGISLGTVAAVIAIVVAVIAGLVAGGILIVKNWETIQKVGSAIWGEIKDLFSGMGEVWDDITSIFRTLMDDISNLSIWEDLIQLWRTIQEVGQEIWPKLEEAFGHLWAVAEPILRFLMELVQVVFGVIRYIFQATHDDIFKIVQGVWDQIYAVISTVIKVIAGIIKLVLDIINGDWGKAWDDIKGIVAAIWDGIVGVLKGAVGIITGIMGTIIDAILAPFKWLYDQLIGHSIIPDLVNGIINWLASLPGKVAGFFLDMMAKGAEAVWQGTLKVIGFFIELPGRILGALGNLGRTLWDKGWELLVGLGDAIIAAAEKVWTFFRELPGKIIGAIGDTGKMLFDVGKNIIQGMINGIGDMAGKVADKAKDVVGGGIKAAKGLLGIGSPSKVFMEIGKNTMQGMIIGLDSQRSDLINQLGVFSQLMRDADMSSGLSINSGTPGAGSTAAELYPVTAVGTQMATLSVTIFDARDPEAVRDVVQEEFDEFLRTWRSQ